jgi:FAD/FMN-containing dehydrogenase
MPLSDETKKRLDARRAEILGRMAASDRVVDDVCKARLRASVLDMPIGWLPTMIRFLNELEADFPDVRIIGFERRGDGSLHVPFKLSAAGWTLERHREVDGWIEDMTAECMSAGGVEHDAS